jgi:pimeloyl-ACP methyl ester carboxylesterase
VLGRQSKSIDWTTCPDNKDTIPHAFSSNFTFECASIEVPLNWLDASNPKTINYFVMRVYNSVYASPPKDQLWMIQGGPGASGAGLENVGINVASQLNRPVTVYVPDNRGTGLSSCLGCNITECRYRANWLDVNFQLCAKQLFNQYGVDSTYFTTTNAAMDIDYAITLSKQANQAGKVYIYGVSYGTYISNRFGLIATNKPDAIVLDSICPADICRIDMFDKNWDFVARSIFTLCALESETCRNYMGSDPNEMLELVQTHFEQQLPFCQGALNVTYQQFYEATLAFVPAAFNRELLPPLINRLLRCSPSDIDEVNYAFKSLRARRILREQTRPISISLPITITVTLSEIYDSDLAHPLSLKEQQGIERTLVFSPQITLGLVMARPYWLTYAPDQYWNQYYTDNIPTLILSGALDPQTPHFYALHAKSNYNKQNQYLVSIPYAPHETVRSDEASCGAQVMASFLSNINGDINTKCTQNITPIDFEGTTDATKKSSQSFFGTPQLWGSA